MRGRGPGPRGHPPAAGAGSGRRAHASRLAEGRPANPNRRARVVQGEAAVLRPQHPAPRRTCGGKARLLPAAGRDPSCPRRRRCAATAAWGAPQGAPLTPGPVPRSSFDCSGDRRRPLGAAGRTRVLASRVDSNLGSSACHLREHKHLIVLLGHRSFHVYNGITMNDS